MENFIFFCALYCCSENIFSRNAPANLSIMGGIVKIIVEKSFWKVEDELKTKTALESN